MNLNQIAYFVTAPLNCIDFAIGHQICQFSPMRFPVHVFGEEATNPNIDSFFPGQIHRRQQLEGETGQFVKLGFLQKRRSLIIQFKYQTASTETVWDTEGKLSIFVRWLSTQRRHSCGVFIVAVQKKVLLLKGYLTIKPNKKYKYQFVVFLVFDNKSMK